jgi:hypothetical protein
MERKKAPRAHGARAQRREAIADTSIPLAERLQIERKQIFKAMGIVSCCRYASDSMLVAHDDTPEPTLIDALQAAYDVLDDVADELQLLIEEREK